ncbi:hypothetical protein BDQ17DRAFT_1349630 [Cyathus striatus]|nr:hypothetical protein BDQ17DRAFT_1349630 [Cyathus striatus]
MDTTEIGEVNEEILQTVQQVYQEVWDEFYTWEQDACQQLLDELHAPEHLPPDIHEFPIQGLYNVTRVDVEDEDDDTDAFIIEEYGDVVPDKDGMIAPIATWYTKTIDVEAEKFLPHPSYDFCTPASRNVYRWRMDEISNMADFIPYADDPTFDFTIMEDFETFAWQVDMQNPDIELILLETIRRLHFGKGMSFEEIDTTNVLSHPIRSSNKTGILWEAMQRDILPWPGSEFSNLPKLPKSAAPPKNNLFEAVNDAIEVFCPNLNCLHSECDTHHGITYARFRPVPALFTNEQIREVEGEPCGVHCFRLFHTDDAAMGLIQEWDNSDLETFDSLLKLIPDTTPCDMSVICRKPCHEVFVYRTRLLPDAQIIEHRPRNEATRLPFAPKRFHPEQILPPCSHPGVCNSFSGCACFENEHHCGRNCRCSLTCPLRRKGCKCGKNRTTGKPLCRTVNCSCVRGKLECDPELCAKKSRCSNVVIQKNQYPPVIIKKSKWGLGAFAGSHIAENRPIGEYVGEMIYNADQLNFVDDLSKHTGLNYVFNFEKEILLDASRIGNETRYLNHSKIKVNAHADVVNVNGLNKIVLRTNRPVKKGEELFLDYGAGYWVHGEPDEVQSD